jgi:hypothetical protein
MYWLRSKFDLLSKNDLEFLIRLYHDVQGELDFVFSDTDNKTIKVEWTINPFNKLLEVLSATQTNVTWKGSITCRLVGPSTVRAVSIPIHDRKINPETFQHPQKQLLLEWANEMDGQIDSQIDCHNDLYRVPNWPETNLGNIEELFLASRLSKLVTTVLPMKHGILISNPRAGYLVCAPLSNDQVNECCTSLMFDTDDGFTSAFSEKSTSVDYINTIFQQWKDSNYTGDLSELFLDKIADGFFL